ncbi:hypothetical protein BDB00DRAFT_256465 [Zychaea mexicana]|uniref:uncharacterized protein n=1 Tax=Zychaea mexicana TaxID=64656 RepID=UPI0022FE5037|nr:uncharacterized protein BDB00DRAFT_256465 [Zychaea mexicana]KAI9495186.1 hypothetical protein BDB00DRAFT_256465 [Zychaea mexicana]
MSGLTAFLQTELLSLSSEARRKHPEIKEAAERLSAILRSFKERPGYNIANELSKSEDALRPFVLACETKQVKLVTIAIGCIQKLISFHAIPETSVRTILRKLTDISVHGVEIQLKILQTALPLLTNYRSVHDDILAEALLICFRLQDSKIVVVNNTAAATLRQLVIFVFDKVTRENAQAATDDEPKHEVQLSSGDSIFLRPCAKDAYYLFQDLCLLTNNEPPEFLRLNHLSKTFGLELVESVLTNHYTLFREHKELSSLLRERVCPFIIKSFSEKHEFPQTMRVTRVVYILIKQFSEILVTECEIFLSMFVKILEPENPHWQRVLAIEIFRGVCGDSLLLCSIYKWYDHQGSSTNVFRDMITAFGRLATERPQLIGATQGGRDSIDHSSGTSSYTLHGSSSTTFTANEANSPCLSAAGSTMRIQCIDQLDKADPPTIPERYIFYLAAVCLNSIADGLAGFALPRFATGSVRSLSSSTIKSVASERQQQKQQRGNTPDTAQANAENTKRDLALITDMANVAWPGLLAAMSFYLSANLDEELFQSTMRSYQNFTNVCGVLDLVVPRDAFLTNLCKNAIPATPVLSSGLFSNKNTGSSTSVATVSTAATMAIAYSDLPVQQQQLLANIVLSDKNLYSLRVLLNIAMFLGGVLGSSWYLILETLQQADFLLFNRPTPKGTAPGAREPGPPSVRRTLSGTTTSASTIATQASVAASNHIAIIHGSLNRLFENSRFLDDNAFNAFTIALCRLSSEASGLPSQEDESLPSSKSSRAKIFNKTSFAIEKLRYISTLDMGRLINPDRDSGTWYLITSHLIATANYPGTPGTIRTQCCESTADIVITAMDFSLSEHKEPDENLQIRLLTALNQCINFTPPKGDSPVFNSDGVKAFTEVQRTGLETLNKLLQTSGHSFTCGWGLIFEMIKHVTTSSSSGQHSADYDDNESNAEDDSRTERTSIDTTASSLRTATNYSTPATNTTASNAKQHPSGLIKVAFASLQLICTDFLSLLSPDCLRQCIATLGAFGMQSEDVNISLTAIGLLWNLSDFIQTKRLGPAKKTAEDGIGGHNVDDTPIEKHWLNIDQPLSTESENTTLSILWMLLLLQLSHVCTDGRPEVRNGANQTLFRTIMMNGSVLNQHLWSACIWEVLFPLLDAIKMSSIRAVRIMQARANKSPTPSTKDDRDASGFMLHHSRDTADKQWDETKVLVLTGLSGIFRDFLGKLYALPKFEHAWSLLLAHLEDSCLRSSQEVSLASIKSFQTIVSRQPEETAGQPSGQAIASLWRSAWQSWLVIGESIVAEEEGNDNDNNVESGEEDQEYRGAAARSTRNKQLDPELYSLTLSLSSSSMAPISNDFSQDMLTAYVNMFTDLYKVIAPTFNLSDAENLLSVLKNVLVYSTSQQYRPDIDHLSPLQEAALNVIQVLDMDKPGIPPLVLRDLSEYMTLAFLGPQDDNSNIFSSNKNKSNTTMSPQQRRYSTVTYIALNKHTSKMVVDMFHTHVDNLSLYSKGVFERIIGAFGLPMKLKYDCPPSYKHGDDKTPLWKLATTGLLDVLRLGLEKLHSFGEEVPLDRFIGVWRTLIDIFHGSLLSPSTPPSSMTIEELDVDEHFDISVLSVIQNDIVIYLGEPRVPDELIEKLVDIVHQSSRLYYVDESTSHRRNTESEEELATKELAIEEESGSGGGGYERSGDIVGTTGTIVPVMKESFAYAALKTLFILCSAEKQNHLEVRKRIARAAIPILLERCETILRNYTADEPLLGRCPFPRVRKEEMLFFLRQSLDLKLQSDILAWKEEDKGTARQLPLSGPRGHLFYLYPTLCRMITCDDPTVVSLIRDCLQIAGSEIGLGFSSMAQSAVSS